MTTLKRIQLIPYDVLMQRARPITEPIMFHEPADWWWAVALGLCCLPLVLRPIISRKKRQSQRRSIRQYKRKECYQCLTH